MDFKTITLGKQGRIATLTLNRPGQLNALSQELMSEFDVALTEVENDRSVRVVIIKGAGRAFSAGYDCGKYAGTQGRQDGHRRG